jgi:hypothetical protein
MSKWTERTELVSALIYLLITLTMIIVGVRHFSGDSNSQNETYWLITGSLLLPWSVFCLYAFLASLHAGSYGSVVLSLFAAALINAGVIYLLVSKSRQQKLMSKN